ncbi:hypothetical protein EJ08DRAFT_650488 [Tothia fuscella]|uniref:Uncharacterized protein n=1 Tax=Tothia fuscella TaxID=1048955 RepID=A0A9P4NP50_9PEZI|nr:hypothetical protein EJ08DRAFT_650488 [Tothia fuscella]
MAHMYLICLVLLAFLKYFRLFVNCIAYWSYKPVPLPDDPLFYSSDVTVVIPALLDGDVDELRETVRSVLVTEPHEVLLVTIDANLEKAQQLAASISAKKIRVLSIPKANKRHQMCRALPCVSTPITIFADDDVEWPATLLPWMLAPFEDPKMGGVGTNQRLRREKHPNIWNFLGAAYLIRRNWDCTACCHIDGGLPCLSGRTVAYRTHILQDDEFQHSFKHETWRSCQLNADDDNFLTRWMVNHGWKTWIQFHPDCEVQTTLNDNFTYLKQCHRWARSNWRSNLTTLLFERTAWRRHIWSVFAVFQTTLTHWSLAADICMLLSFWQISANWTAHTCGISRGLCFIWVVVLCRIIKYCRHFSRYPQDLLYLPIIPLFGYYHSCFIKTYAMITMHSTTWGSRDGADTNDSFRLIRLPRYGTSTSTPTTAKSPVHELEEAEHTFLDHRVPLLPKYDGPSRTRNYGAIPFEDAPDYESPDEEVRSQHFY